MKPTWKKYLLYGSVVIVGGMLLFILIETVRAKNTGFETKTLWNWMELLVIPLVLAGGAFYLERSERAVDRKTADDRAKLEREAAENRAKLERELATDRQQEAALQAYLDRMAELLLQERLLTSNSEEVRNVARTRTITVLRVLDARRKGLVLQFLYEASLIKPPGIPISLRNAPLQNTDLHGADLQGADLTGADLSGADLSDAILFGSKLIHCKLIGSNLRHATLRSADLQSADLTGANLRDANTMHIGLNFANLKDADLTGTILEYRNDPEVMTSLKGATMPDGTQPYGTSLSLP